MKTRAKKSEKPAKEEQRPDLMIRAATVETITSEDGKNKTVRMSVSSEEPVLQYAYVNDQWQRVFEILDHSPKACDMSRCKDGLVILDRHYGDQIGLMACDLKEKKLSGDVAFCTGNRAQEIAADAAKGLRRNVSVGYTVDAGSYRIEGSKDGIPVVRAMSWMPYEASFEPVPADTTVGVNRAAETVVTITTQAEEKKMDPKLLEEIAALRKMIEDQSKSAAEIVSLRAKIAELEARKVEKPVVPQIDQSANVPLGGDAKEQAKIVRKYSLMNVIRAMCGQKVDIQFEREVGEESAKVSHRTASGIMVPHAVLATRDVTKSGTTSASIATDLLSAEFIDLLRTNTILSGLGVRFLSGLVGDIAIPKLTAGATGYWVAEASDITESTPTMGQVTGSPHTCGAFVDISRRMIQQSTPSAEQFIRNEIIERVARTVQIAVFAGAGTAEPWAITHTTGINNPSVTQGTPTYAELLGFPGNIMSDNASADNMKWAMTGEVWQKLAATFTDGTAKAEHVLDYNSKTCLGFPYLVSEDVGANSLFFGNWAMVVVGVWGNGVDLKVDDVTLDLSGGVRLIGLQDVDVMVRHGQALAYNAAVTS